ncbi:hypothetical protein [Paenibacillus sp. R14(2021)]|uniref:hypothetical protein n=1 Tax=Paenibacillus sp. R14(2021) TaxID=2859228 RepID=UPI001C61370C|nr:hypothetical protein [Paenibacillus sp. R14(2021)]
MCCWIGTCIIVNNKGTILFGNADTFPSFDDDGDEDDTDEAETNAETDTPGNGVNLMARPRAASRTKKRGRASGTRLGGKKSPSRAGRKPHK